MLFANGRKSSWEVGRVPMILNKIDLICFSHLRWGFVFQRPQHLMSRFARERRVFYIEEPVFRDVGAPRISRTVCEKTGVSVVTPVLPEGFDGDCRTPAVESLVDEYMREQDISDFI